MEPGHVRRGAEERGEPRDKEAIANMAGLHREEKLGEEEQPAQSWGWTFYGRGLRGADRQLLLCLLIGTSVSPLSGGLRPNTKANPLPVYGGRLSVENGSG